MGVGSNSDLALVQMNKSRLNCPISSGISPWYQFENIVATTSLSTDSFLVGAGWDSLGSVDSRHHLLTPENPGVSSISHLVQYPPEVAFKFNNQDQSSLSLSRLESGCYPGAMALIGAGEDANHVSTNQEDQPTISNDGVQVQGPLLDVKKRKRMPDGCMTDSNSQLDSIQSIDIEQQNDTSLSGKEGSNHKDDKKQKSEQSSGTIAQKQTSKQAKDNSRNANSPKEEYIHVRARRGKATNSHSLAERVRREKISERMKFLQDLVPGCNKITGKAVMLDEIINYVQSLQRQVEFLSMKLATVNPDLNFDIERVLSSNILHLQGGGTSALGFCRGMTISRPHLNGFQQHGIHSAIDVSSVENSANMLKTTNPQSCSLPQISGVWDNELQSVFQMGFVSNAPADILDLHGQMKLEP